MAKSAFDQEALIEMFSSASAKQSQQLRQTVCDTTLRALQGRELTLKNIKKVLESVSQAASAGVAQNPATGDVQAMLDGAVAGMDDALLKAVDANRVALQQFAAQGVDLREGQLKKALADLEKFEDAFFDSLRKSADGASSQLGAQWGQVLEKFQLKGTLAGAEATRTAEDVVAQVQDAVRSSRAAGLKAAQAMAESYAALVSGVLIGMSDALRQGGRAADVAEAPAAKKAAPRRR